MARRRLRPLRDRSVESELKFRVSGPHAHARLRAAWGFPDPADLALEDKLAARYRGKRYSFGYPACPDLAFQRELFHALRPEEIGVELTEGDMMEPEASVSALVFHHPDARYFGV